MNLRKVGLQKLYHTIKRVSKAIAGETIRAYNIVMRIYDISIPISPTMPTYPGDPPVTIEPVLQIAAGDAANVSRLAFGNHTGTHVDPPAHFIHAGKTIDQLDLNVLCGTVRVVDLSHVKHTITVQDLGRAKIPSRTKRLILKTRNSDLWRKSGFQEEFVALTPDAAQWLVAHRVQLVGIDYLSIEPFGAKEPAVHRTMLGAGVVVIEGLDLSLVKPGKYTLACLPLKIAHGDGAPARAILFEE